MNKSLVAFFSATGTTKKTAELIASAANADLYEILPKIPYSASDLDWMDNHSRSSMEMKDKTYCRPELADSNRTLEHTIKFSSSFHLVVFAPTLINTFLESYDFSGRKSYCSPHPAAADLEIPKKSSVLQPDAILTDGKLCNHMQKRN